MRESVKLVRQALDKMPGGSVNIDDPTVVIPTKHDVYTKMESLILHFKHYMDGHGMDTPKRGEVYSATEAPNGELGWFVMTDGGNRAYRVRVRPPSLMHYASVPAMITGGLLADAVATLSSVNVIAGELDR
jgi:NADH:ubiquinone oxidoreductase subunit D